MVARGLGALDVVHRLDEVVDAERDRGDEDDAEELEAAEDVVDRRERQREAEVREGGGEPAEAHAGARAGRARAAPQATSMPKAMATRPAGMPRG